MKRLGIHRQHGKPAGQRGVGLIEVMVAVLVVSIGFLGVAALQVFSLSTNNSAMARSMATMGTYSILDAMRADRDNAIAQNYDTTVHANNCASVGSGTLAKKQLTRWCEQLGHDLGDLATTTGTVNCDAIGNCVITISYDDSRAGAEGIDANGNANPVTQTVTTRAAL